MAKELESVKKERRFMKKSVTDTLKLISEALAEENNHATIQVLKNSTLDKWNDLPEIQASLSTYLEDTEIMNVHHTVRMR